MVLPCQAGPSALAFVCTSRWWLIPTSPVQVPQLGRCIDLTPKGPLVSFLQTIHSQPLSLPVRTVAWLMDVPQKSFLTCYILPQQSSLLHICYPLPLAIHSPLALECTSSQPGLLAVWCTGLGSCPLSQGPCTLTCVSSDSFCWCANICPPLINDYTGTLIY